MDNDKFVELCKEKVAEYVIGDIHNTPSYISKDSVYVVWLNRTLQNNKAFLSTTVSDGMYYEVTYNGDKNELYFDAYSLVHNEAIELGD